MQICIECGRQLFDYDKSCDKCNSQNIISEKEYKEIINEINCSNIIKKRILLQNHNYKCVYDRLQKKEKVYPSPIILRNNNLESIEGNEEYWDRINQHTINKTELQKPIVECPYCKSTNTSKISTTSKAVNTVLFGILGTKRYKEWHCNECGSNF